MKKVKSIKCYHGESVLTKEEEKEKKEKKQNNNNDILHEDIVRHSKNYLEENLASYTDILNQYCATLDQIVKEYKEQSRFISNSLKDIIKFLKN